MRLSDHGNINGKGQTIVRQHQKGWMGAKAGRDAARRRQRAAIRSSDFIEHPVAARIVRAAGAAIARSSRPGRGAEAKYPRRHELPLLWRGRNVIHREAKALS